jgi:putative redox protein
MTRAVVVAAGHVKYVQDIAIGPHALHADEPEAAGGRDAGPSPYELLLAALGTCTAITVQMYADHRQWLLRSVQVRLSHGRVHADDCTQCATQSAKLDRIELAISMDGDLTDQQRRRLLNVAARCPVHNTLSAPISIDTREWRDSPAPE